MSPDRYLPARTPVKDVVPVTGLVTSRNLLHFLTGTSSNFPYKDWTFSPKINLKEYSPAFKELYDTKKDVYVFSEEIRNAINIYPDNPFYKKDAAERATTIYLDLNKSALCTYGINQGEYASTSVSTFTHRTSTIIPLIEAHTHPEDVLPSPIDYSRMLLKDPEYDRRVVYGIVVLCPDKQILALPTYKTPIFEDWDSLHALLETWRTEINDRITPYSLKRLKRIGDIHKAAINRIIKNKDAVLAKEVANQAVLLQDETNRKYLGLANYWRNVLLSDFIRDMSIQLYTATDMQHFSKATA